MISLCKIAENGNENLESITRYEMIKRCEDADCFDEFKWIGCWCVILTCHFSSVVNCINEYQYNMSVKFGILNYTDYMKFLQH